MLVVFLRPDTTDIFHQAVCALHSEYQYYTQNKILLHPSEVLLGVGNSDIMISGVKLQRQQ